MTDLGATAGTGLEIVRQASERGHPLTALVRSPERLKPFRDRITPSKRPFEYWRVEEVIRGNDAVPLGHLVPTSRYRKLMQTLCALTSAMSSARVKRVVVEAVAFLLRIPSCRRHILLGSCFPKDRRRHVGHGADFRAKRTRMHDSPPAATCRHSIYGKVPSGRGSLASIRFQNPRADVADFMIGAVENRSSQSFLSKI